MSPQELEQIIRRIKRLPDNLLRRVIRAATHEEQKRLQKNLPGVLEKWAKG